MNGCRIRRVNGCRIGGFLFVFFFEQAGKAFEGLVACAVHLVHGAIGDIVRFGDDAVLAVGLCLLRNRTQRRLRGGIVRSPEQQEQGHAAAHAP